MFKKANVWDMVERSPFEKLDRKNLPENNKRDRFLSKEEIRRLLPECSKHLRPIVETALHTGLRQGEVLGLKWKDIDFRRERLFVEKAPDNLTKPGGWVDMNSDLVALMKSLRPKGRIPKPDAYVFTYAKNEDKLKGFEPIEKRKKPAPAAMRVNSVRTSFMAALKRAGIEGVTFHTLRHHSLSYGNGRLYATGDSGTAATQRHQDHDAIHASFTKAQEKSGKHLNRVNRH